MIEVPLTKGYVAIVDDVDAWIADVKWRVNINHRSMYGLRSKKQNGRQYQFMLHRVLMERIVGRTLTKDEIVDHIDGDGLNNVRSNLRLCTRSQNMWNKKAHRNTSTGLKGVTFVTGHEPRNWKAQIHVGRKNIYLGYHDTPEAAHKAYCDAAQFYFGEYWRAA